MKTWQIVALVGVAGLILVVVVMSNQPKVVGASPQAGFRTPDSSLAGLGAFVGGLFKDKVTAPSAAPNDGTYRPDIKPTVTGNTLTDPNTGKQLVYGTD